ncbi:MAG: NAD(P)/FAD-dependent oxidoreductase [Candidatus Heimdallarchaeota archaeon]|nr:NAD(P)/FAD-dependent oxidoreductase [Candidatus Heimdallarchaeota archaeon]
MEKNEEYDVAIIGAGFSGLASAFFLSKRGRKTVIVDGGSEPGGLASSFKFNDGVEIEKYYHHWFQNDEYIIGFLKELGLDKNIESYKSKTGMLFKGKMWKLATPMDLLRFTPISFFNRVRLGLLVFRVRLVRNWKKLEKISVHEWLRSMVGEKVYSIVWAPLIRAKFSKYAEDINAAWMWKKLVLRGGTRSSDGSEMLLYYKGGFGALARQIASRLETEGCDILYQIRAEQVEIDNNEIKSLILADGRKLKAKQFIFTNSFPQIVDLMKKDAPVEWIRNLERVKYLGNICLVLELKHSLSHIYWLNVNDDGFPFVGVIEHTNFVPPEKYQGKHIVFLSNYISEESREWALSDEEYYKYCIKYIRDLNAEFDENWILDYKIWKGKYAQPITDKNFSRYLPGHETPYSNAYICTMAQVYPQDRGTNYAVRDGYNVSNMIHENLKSAAITE